jgi:Protein of unknown function (DUF4240)
MVLKKRLKQMTLLELPIQDVSMSALMDLKSRYPSATVRVEWENMRPIESMNEAQFWAIIDLFDWRTQNSDAILAPAIHALAELSLKDIHTFHNVLNEKLYTLDGRRFAEQLGRNRYTSDDSACFSVDSFLYARCCVVANGKTFYEKVLQSPAKMPKEYTFESLLYLPQKAWHKKTGRDSYNYFPEVWSETFSNSDGWEGMTTLKDRLINLL